MLSYFLKCRKNIESKNPKVVKTKKEGECFYETVPLATVKNQDLSKSEKLVGY